MCGGVPHCVHSPDWHCWSTLTEWHLCRGTQTERGRGKRRKYRDGGQGGEERALELEWNLLIGSQLQDNVPYSLYAYLFIITVLTFFSLALSTSKEDIFVITTPRIRRSGFRAVSMTMPGSFPGRRVDHLHSVWGFCHLCVSSASLVCVSCVLSWPVS